MSKKIFIAAASISMAFMISGCQPSDSKAISLGQKEITYAMKDPTSVIFRNDKFVGRKEHDDGKVTGYVCGEVNAKNAFGAYAGFSSYVVELEMRPKDYSPIGVNYKVIMMSIAPSEPHELQRYKQYYREICQAEAIRM
ncbi:hypothetical protein STT07_003653 [Cronobacter sakazakii]|uniref:hypothetical protein n=1 Tax=Cronobacter sakazakii TaxID=28141 RepID=UPI002A566434|nr:hypothetical protein [Cronobacter sakazakii]ELZ1652424.1 hypothetical protein [Cronobacter sakazakii]MEB8578109.1 hypothetical protein [Cronobacter sakazakii]